MSSWIVRMLALAGINYLAGELALLLAIPPGYASALWPPAGIALAAVLVWGYRVLPGVMLGAFLLNVQIGNASERSSILLSIGISVASTLQAALGAALVRRFIEFPNPFIRQRDIILFFILGGPLACICAATLSVALLQHSGLVYHSNLFYSWWTWWVGDSIGVLIFSPLFFIAFGQPRDVWKRRNLTVALPLFIAVAGVTILFVFASSRERQRHQLEFNEHCTRLANDITDQLRSYDEVMWSIARFFDSSSHVTREDFRRFTEPTLQRLRAIQALTWNPRVLDFERYALEAKVQATDISTFQITEMNDDVLVPALHRAEYFPILYIVPFQTNMDLVGFDSASEPVRFDAQQRALITHQTAMTGLIYLVQDKDARRGVIMYTPVFDTDSLESSTNDWHNSLEGYAAGIFRIDDIVDEALDAFTDPSRIQFRILDATDPGHEQDLYSGRWQLREVELNSQFDREIEYVFGGRKWILQFHATPEYVGALVRWQSWAVDAVGLALASLLGILLLILDGRAVELRIANTKLQEAVQAREEFLSIASHELRTPLTPLKLQLQSISRLLARNNSAPGDNDRLGKSFHAIDNQVDRLTRLVDELLDTSRITVGRLVLERQPVEMCRIVEEVLERHAKEFRAAATVVTLHAPVLIIGYFDRLRMEQVVTNLVTNALKYAPGKPVLITIEKQGDRLVLTVKDQGPGISKADLERIFDRFEQVIGPGQQRGLGLGLFIVKQIVEAHGGTIRAESAIGHGATFIVEMPLNISSAKP